MRKRIFLSLIILLTAVPFCFAGIRMSVDTSFSFVRGSQGMPGLGVSAGLYSEKIRYSIYISAGVSLYPGGSRTGMNVAGEFEVETGARVLFDLADYGSSVIFTGLSAGYYSQYISLPVSKNDYYRLNNGIIIKPQLGIRLKKVMFCSLELGLGYQKVLWPSFRDYDGFFVLLRFV